MATVPSIFRASLILLSSTAMSSCFWGDTNSGTSDDPDTLPMTIVPSLGLVTNAVVEVYKADGAYFSPRLGGSTGTSGRYQVSVDADQTYPLKVEMRPSASSSYFDESSESFEDNSSSELPTLVAWIPEYRASVAVTPFTTLAAQLLADVLDENETLTANDVINANEAVAEAFGLGEFDLLTAPTLVNDSNDVLQLGNSAAEIHAALLTAMAEVGAGLERPAAQVAKDLIADIDDGILDGSSSSGSLIVSYAQSDDFPALFSETLLGLKDTRFASTFSYSTGSTSNDIQTIFNAKQDDDADDGREPIGSGTAATQCFNADAFALGTSMYLQYEVTDSEGIEYWYEYTYDNVSSGSQLERQGTFRVSVADSYEDNFTEAYALDSSSQQVTFSTYVNEYVSGTQHTEYNVLYTPGYTLDFSLEAGAANSENYVENRFNYDSNTETETRYEREWLYRGDESISVPAASGGSFTACRFQETLTNQDTDAVSNSVYWYAVDSGVMIKAESGGYTYKLLKARINGDTVTP